MAKRGYVSEGDLAEVCSIRSPQVEKRLVDSRLLLLFHDVVLVGREQHPPQPLALVVVNVRPFGVAAHLRVHAI